MTGVFLQVRLGSIRLPNKALLKLGSVSVIEHAMRSLRKVTADRFVVLTDEDSAHVLEPLAGDCDFEFFAGPRDDVLLRFVLAGREYGVDRIVRATGDNPLVSWELASMLLSMHADRGADFSAFDGPPLGTGVEIVELAALERAVRESVDEYDHEHVSPYLYRNPDLFRIHRTPAPAEFRLPGARVTLDTHEDYLRLRKIFDDLFTDEPISIAQLVAWLRSQKDDAYSSPA